MPRKPLELQSLKWPFVGLAVLLALSSIWAVYDEVVPRRPWKNYQREFFKLEESHLKADREQAQKRLESAETKQQLDAARADVKAATDAISGNADPRHRQAAGSVQRDRQAAADGAVLDLESQELLGVGDRRPLPELPRRDQQGWVLCALGSAGGEEGGPGGGRHEGAVRRRSGGGRRLPEDPRRALRGRAASARGHSHRRIPAARRAIADGSGAGHRVPAPRHLGEVGGARRGVLRSERALVREDEGRAEGRERRGARGAEAAMERDVEQPGAGRGEGRGEAHRGARRAGVYRQGVACRIRGGGEDQSLRREAGLSHAPAPL